MTLQTQFKREGNLLISGDEEVLVKAQKDSNKILAELDVQGTDEAKAQKALIEMNRALYANFTPNVQNLAKLFDKARSSADSFYAEKYVELKADVLKANELATADKPQVERYTVTARDL
ncbi:hypothetical protein [Rummeliibacillus pycnus]|uniref:hypothetical protein n=1 Tax=Rummeliibacillus pycnus TaxID=101070 RepID=UPI000C9C10C4|nr:hypothetical protein [Rummeliibacillus pycnus]